MLPCSKQCRTVFARAALVLLALSADAFANSPSNVDAVVRIQAADPSIGGTGTLVAAGQVGDQYRMVLLVADHTLQRGVQVATIGFGNQVSPNLDISMAAASNVTIYDKGPDGTEDMALIGVTVSLSSLSASDRTYLTGVNPLAVVAAPPDPLVPFEITATGFGRSGTVTTFGLQQSFNNVIDRYASAVDITYTTDAQGNSLFYTQSMLGWTYNDASTGDWVAGEGAGYGGYSGAPLRAFGTNDVIGIQTNGSDTVNGAKSIGVRFTSQYVNWIEGNALGYVQAVPEPTRAWSFVAGLFVIGALGFARRPR